MMRLRAKVAACAFVIPGFLTLLAAQAQEPNRLPAGLMITAVMSRSIHAAKAKPGDAVDLQAQYAVLNAGQVVIPEHAKLRGTVERSEPLGGNNRASVLVIRIHRADWKGGSAVFSAYVNRLLAVVRRMAIPPETPCVLGQYELNCPPNRARQIRTTKSSPSGDVTVRRLQQPAGATMLVSTKRNVELKKGAAVELFTTPE